MFDFKRLAGTKSPLNGRRRLLSLPLRLIALSNGFILPCIVVVLLRMHRRVEEGRGRDQKS